jgi:hypothetical protein
MIGLVTIAPASPHQLAVAVFAVVYVAALVQYLHRVWRPDSAGEDEAAYWLVAGFGPGFGPFVVRLRKPAGEADARRGGGNEPALR